MGIGHSYERIESGIKKRGKIMFLIDKIIHVGNLQFSETCCFFCNKLTNCVSTNKGIICSEGYGKPDNIHQCDRGGCCKCKFFELNKK